MINRKAVSICESFLNIYLTAFAIVALHKMLYVKQFAFCLNNTSERFVYASSSIWITFFSTEQHAMSPITLTQVAPISQRVLMLI